MNCAFRQLPGVTGALPTAAATAFTRSARPAVVGCTPSRFKTPGCVEAVPQSRIDTLSWEAATVRITSFVAFWVSRKSVVVRRSVGRGASDPTIDSMSFSNLSMLELGFVPRKTTAASHPSFSLARSTSRPNDAGWPASASTATLHPSGTSAAHISPP